MKELIVAEKIKVFISYSRQDKSQIDRLYQALLGDDELEVFLDEHDIAAAENWKERLESLIRAADTVIFATSPASAASDICRWEVEQAAALNKRILPVILKDVPDGTAPDEIARLNYIFLRNDVEFKPALISIGEALKIDIDWVREHTRLAALAHRWDLATQLGAQPLRGKELEGAENWLASQPKNAPPPTELQRRYVLESRRMAGRRQRNIAVSSVVALVIVALLSVFAFQQRNVAVSARDLAVAAEDVANQQRKLAEIARDEAEEAEAKAIERKNENRNLYVKSELRTSHLIATSGLQLEDTANAQPTRILAALMSVQNPTKELDLVHPTASRFIRSTAFGLANANSELSHQDIYRLAISQDGKRLLSIGGFDTLHRIFLWDLETGGLIEALWSGGPSVSDAEFLDESGRYFFIRNAANQIGIYDTVEGKYLDLPKTSRGWADYSFGYDRQKNRVIIGDGQLQVFSIELDTGQSRQLIFDPSLRGSKNSSCIVRVSSKDGDATFVRVFHITGTSAVVFEDVDTRQKFRVVFQGPHIKKIGDCAADTVSNKVVFSTGTGHLAAVDMDSRNLWLSARNHGKKITALKFDELAGVVVVSGRDENVYAYSFHGEPKSILFDGTERSIDDIALAPRKNHLMYVTNDDVVFVANYVTGDLVARTEIIKQSDIRYTRLAADFQRDRFVIGFDNRIAFFEPDMKAQPFMDRLNFGDERLINTFHIDQPELTLYQTLELGRSWRKVYLKTAIDDKLRELKSEPFLIEDNDRLRRIPDFYHHIAIDSSRQFLMSLSNHPGDYQTVFLYALRGGTQKAKYLRQAERYGYVTAISGCEGLFVTRSDDAISIIAWDGEKLAETIVATGAFSVTLETRNSCAFFYYDDQGNVWKYDGKGQTSTLLFSLTEKEVRLVQEVDNGSYFLVAEKVRGEDAYLYVLRDKKGQHILTYNASWNFNHKILPLCWQECGFALILNPTVVSGNRSRIGFFNLTEADTIGVVGAHEEATSSGISTSDGRYVFFWSIYNKEILAFDLKKNTLAWTFEMPAEVRGVWFEDLTGENLTVVDVAGNQKTFVLDMEKLQSVEGACSYLSNVMPRVDKKQYATLFGLALDEDDEINCAFETP